MNNTAPDDRETVVDATERFGGRGPAELEPATDREEPRDRPGRRFLPPGFRRRRTAADNQPRPTVDGRATPTEEAGAKPRLPARRRRPAEPDGAELVRRAERRARRARAGRTVGGWLLVRGWWTVRGAGWVTSVGLYRVVWQPGKEDHINRMKEIKPDAALHAAQQLSHSRKTRLVLVAASAALAPEVGPVLFHLAGQFIPWWGDIVAAGIAMPVLAAAGRPQRDDTVVEAVHELEELPDGLSLDASDRGVAATLAEGLADRNLRGQVHGVRRAPGGWGWTATLSLLDELTEAKLAALERFLNCPLGGLVLSPVPTAARVRYLRIVMVDLLAESAPAVFRQPATLPADATAELGNRFDGGRLKVALFARHLLLIGRTRSGKSGALHVIVYALVTAGIATIGIDLAAGPDLRTWEPALEDYVGADYAKALRVLRGAVELIQDRTARLGHREWNPQVDGPGLAIVIDEYGLLAQVPKLRALAEYVVTYGAKAGVGLVAANQRKVNEMMGSSQIGSQVHIKLYMSMAEEDADALPKAVRAQGVRPNLFRQASRGDDGDAGKTWVLGVEEMPILSRFDRMTRAEAHQHADDLTPNRPELADRDREPLRRSESDGMPRLPLLVRDAIVDIAGAAGRTPARASVGEIAERLSEQGYAVDKDALTRKLREELGELAPRSRDTNLGPHNNPKGFRLDDVEQSLRAVRQRLQAQQDPED